MRIAIPVRVRVRALPALLALLAALAACGKYGPPVRAQEPPPAATATDEEES